MAFDDLELAPIRDKRKGHPAHGMWASGANHGAVCFLNRELGRQVGGTTVFGERFWRC